MDIKPVDGNYATLMKLKQFNGDIKILLAIGRWNNFDAMTYSIATSSDLLRSQLAVGIRDFVTKYNFDGVVLNWIDPGDASRGQPQDAANYVHFVTQLRNELRNNLTIAATGSPFRPNIKNGDYPLQS